jgi:heat-inducible transcriptional repressor
MELDDRKKHILKILINDYIKTAEPIGSRTIAKKPGIGISPATIRNEMADLEDMGYLEQPHTSAGRIPSDKGYRIYVDYLMSDFELSQDEVNLIKNNVYKVTLGEIDRIVKDTTKILSALTNYTALVVPPQMSKTTIKHIQLVAMDSMNILAVVVTNIGVVKSVMIKLTKPITTGRLTTINNIMNDKLKGLTIEDINLKIISDMLKGMTGYSEILNEIVPVLYESLKCIDVDEVYLEGSSNIFNYPEYNAIDKAKSFLAVLESKDFFKKMMFNDNDSVKISIGHENEIDAINDCSLITTTYKIGDDIVGSIGIIGPTRMYYSKVLAVLNNITDCLSDLLTEYYMDE